MEYICIRQVRPGLDISYDRLSNYDSLSRQIMGVESSFGCVKREFSYQTILDNVGLLDEKTLHEINDEIVQMGHGIFKKKEDEPLNLKADSYVVESTVHFPTDYNLLWDSARKCLTIVNHLLKRQPRVQGWR